MAIWNRKKVSPTMVNSGKQYVDKVDSPSADDFNAAENNAFYAVDFAEALADTPDISEVGNIGTPSVSLVDNIKTVNGEAITYKKFKFKNMKGEHGEDGVSLRNMGAWATATSYSANAEYIDIAVYENTAYLCKLSHTSSASILPTNTTYWEIISNGVVSATINEMDITFTFADGTTQTLEIQTETAEVVEIDSVPTNNSTNLVTSGGVKTALDEKQDTLTFDSTPRSGSVKPVTSGGVKTALDEKQNTLIFDTVPTNGSNKPVTSGGVYNSTYGKVYKSIFDLFPQGAVPASTEVGDIVTAMGASTILISKDPMSILPNLQTGLKHSSLGTLQIIVDGNRNAVLTFSTKPPNSTEAVYYTSYYRRTGTSNNWSGWKLMVDDDMPLLWSGTWTDGNITVAGISNYKMIVVRLQGSTAPSILTRLQDSTKFVGGGIMFSSDVNQISEYIELAISGNTLTRGAITRLTHTSAGNHTAMQTGMAVANIWGIM